MANDKEVWIQHGDHAGLESGGNSTVVLRGEPKIHFLRGNEFHSSYEHDTEEHRIEFSSPVACPVPKKTVANWKKLKRKPDSSSVVRISVDVGVMTNQKLKLKVGGKTQELEVEEFSNGMVSKQMFLFVYGEGCVDELEGIKCIDVSKGDAFEEFITIEAGLEKREFGLVDFLIKDPDDGKFHSARYGIFKTRTPSIKLICSKVGANNLKVLIDDGNDDTADQINITKLLSVSGNVTHSDLPLSVAQDNTLIEGEWDKQALRGRVYSEAPADGKDLGILLIGENRIRIYDEHAGEIIYLAHFLLYEDEDEPVIGSWYGEDSITLEKNEISVAANHVLLDFKEGTKNVSISECLHALHLIPQGFTPDAKIIQASPFYHTSAETLKSLIENAVKAGIGELESGGMDYVEADGGPESVSLERYPESIRVDFNAGNSGFNNGRQFFFHHFYIHTFPAHRLIDHERFGNTSPPSVIVEGAHFLNKTFLAGAAKATIDALMHARLDNPSRKIALFGHADTSGVDISNTILSGFRAETTHALLIKDPDVWLKRLDGAPLISEAPWGLLEIQMMLKQLGHFSGAPNGADSAASQQASRQFLSTAGLPSNAKGHLDRAARRRLISDYMDNLVGPNPLLPIDFHQDPSGKPALYACGSHHLLLPSEPTSSQNRRVTIVLRMTPPPGPIELSQRGAAAPYPAWIAPEPDAAAKGGDNPPFVVGCWDTGFGGTTGANPDNFSGDNLDAPNRLFLRGRRIIRPTLLAAAGVVNRRVFRDGDLSGTITTGGTTVTMSDAAGSTHGSSVMTTMTADGLGDDIGGTARSASQTVLGTGKDVKFRPLRQNAFDFTSANQRYKVMTSDAEVKVVSTSLDVRHFEFLTKAQKATRTKLVKAMITSGKLFFLAAANVNTTAAELGRRDVARTEGGFFAPSRKVKRSSLTGGNAFKRNIAAVGASSDVGNNLGVTEFPTSFTFLGEEVSVACPGANIRALQSADPSGTLANVNNMFILNISGTSFSTPMTAGIAGELMLANPILQQTANLPRVMEMIEATADPIPSLAAAPLAQQGPYLPGAVANVDAQLTAPDLAGFRRVHFWKAVLAALNDGLPTEQKIPNPAGGGNIAATSHFDQLSARDAAATIWYGFEIRTAINHCSVFFKRKEGTFTRIEDSQAALPQARRIAETWRKVQDYKAPVGHAQAGFVLPAYPFTGAAPVGITVFFMTQFSVKREELERYAELVILPPGLDPSSGDFSRVPPLSKMPIATISRMRDPANITAPEKNANAELARIAAHIEDFDDFVFHWTIKPTAIKGFIIVHTTAANIAEEIDVRIFAVDSLSCLNTSFNGAVNISHNGTNGVSGATNQGIFIDGNQAGLSTAVNLVNGIATFKLSNHTTEKFKLSASDGTNKDDGASPEINIALPGKIDSIAVTVSHFDGRDVEANPPRIGDRLKYSVTILDTDKRTKTNFKGRVDLKVIQGRMGKDGPPKSGVFVIDAEPDPFKSTAFNHDFKGTDHGKFDFSVFHFSTGEVELGAMTGTVSGNSPIINIKAGALDHFSFGGPTTQNAGNPINLEIRPRDKFDNLIEDFSGRVQLSTLPVVMVGVSGATGNTGVFIGNTQTASDDFVDFRDVDLGVKTIPVNAFTGGTYQIHASSGAINSDCPLITVNAPAAAANFKFDTGTSQRTQTQFPVTVTALDAAGNQVPNFTGAVTLSRVSGPNATFFLTPHTYAKSDNGSFTFSVRPSSAGTLVLRARSGAVQANISITIS